MSSNRKHSTFSTSRHFQIASEGVACTPSSKRGMGPHHSHQQPNHLPSFQTNIYLSYLSPVTYRQSFIFPTRFSSLQPLTVPILYGTGSILYHVLTILRFRRTFSLSTSTPAGCGFPTSPAVCKLSLRLVASLSVNTCYHL